RQVLDRGLVEPALGERGEKDGILALEQEPLEVGEQRMRVVAHGFGGKIEGHGMFRGKARRRETLHLGPVFSANARFPTSGGPRSITRAPSRRREAPIFPCRTGLLGS